MSATRQHVSRSALDNVSSHRHRRSPDPYTPSTFRESIVHTRRNDFTDNIIRERPPVPLAAGAYALASLQKHKAIPLQLQDELTAPNRTGLSDALKASIEALSGMSIDDVRIHYNSARPAHVGALAFAQGSDIHVAPGQEQHVPHEAWHVVQQRQGRVPVTAQLKGVSVNDDPVLEREADIMGKRAARDAMDSLRSPGGSSASRVLSGPVQMKCEACTKKDGEIQTRQAPAFSTAPIVDMPLQMSGRKNVKAKSKYDSDSKESESSSSKRGGPNSIEHHGCYSNDNCTSFLNKLKYCHNCKESGGSHVKWSGSNAAGHTVAFCFKCNDLGIHEADQKKTISDAINKNLAAQSAAAGLAAR